MISTDEYWLRQDAADVADYLTQAHQQWAARSNDPFKQMWLRNYLAYYSPVLHLGGWDTSLVFEGVQGELVRLYAPKARVLIRQLTNIVTKQRLAFKATASDGSGAATMDQVKLANAISSQVVTKQNLNSKVDQLVEGGLVMGLWFTKATWRSDFGTDYVVDDRGNKIKNGEVEIEMLSPFNVFYNTGLPWEKQPYVECRVIRNRWDLIADFPDLESEIKSLPSAWSHASSWSWANNNIMHNDDMVCVYEMYASSSSALPNGRMLMYSDSETIYFDGPNKYGCIPIEPNIPEAVLDTGYGYSKLSDLLGAQEMFDNSLSAIATNESALAVQNVAVARGSNININELSGMNFIEFTPMQGVAGGGKPEPLNLANSAPSTFKFADKLEQVMQELSLLNGAMTGNLPPGVSSGTAIATLSANSIEFITSISKSYALCMERTMMHVVNAYQKFAEVPRRVTLAQKGGQETTRNFTGKDIKDVTGVNLEITNVLMQAIAGRLEVGEKLLTMPREMWPEYAAILEGRPLSEIYKGDVSEFDLISQENEAMELGQNVPALATDDHAMHIKRHSECLSDVQVRQNGQAVQAILTHIEQHYQLLKQGDPTLQGIIKTGMIPEGGIPKPPPSPPSGTGQGGPPPGARTQAQDAPGRTPRDIPQDIPGEIAEPTQDLLGRG